MSILGASLGAATGGIFGAIEAREQRKAEEEAKKEQEEKDRMNRVRDTFKEHKQNRLAALNNLSQSVFQMASSIR